VKSILIIGSYTGQSSVGDIGLLRCVAEQFRRNLGQNIRLISHVLENVQDASLAVPGVEFHPGVQGLLLGWYNKLRHLRLPSCPRLLLSILTFPCWILAKRDNRLSALEFLKDIQASRIVYYYGGTQLSRQWFMMNFPALLMTALVARLLGRPLYVGPQQYGPQTHWQRVLMRMFRRSLVTEIRARNAACSQSLGLPNSKLLLDEIYSCQPRFPVSTGKTRAGRFILVNLREQNFLRPLNEDEFRSFGVLLEMLHSRLSLPFKLFQMSGTSFSDDTRGLRWLKKHGFHPSEIQLLPPFAHEEELIGLAQEAYGCVSMSFHGCIRAMIGGCPAIPITSGEYYDHKYLDFYRYTGGQSVPIVRLDSNVLRNSEAMLAYFATYSPETTAAARAAASERMKGWYQLMASQIHTRARPSA
jgi:hypothetical protein